MSLTKLFNVNYFIQNIKKSLSGIIFASIILPIFTLLTILLCSTDNSSMVMDFSTLSIFNILFMYVIPIVLSISLFSYVFKKNSSDFVGSLPLSRKTIFTTNTIGGIILIALIQLITAIIILLASIATSNLIIFGAMVWDIFVYFTITYIFVFIVCNLAMSFSGNMYATIAGTMLILFFIPFLLFTSRTTTSWMSNAYYDNLNKEDSNYITFYEPFNFTAPSYFMDCMVSDVEYQFNIPSLLKMIIFSVVYFMIGFILFNRKKFEMAEESYESDNVHLIVKFLSLAPFFAVGVEGEVITNLISFVFFFAVVAAYYFLFDVITKKKIKIGKTILTFIVFSALMYTVFAFIVPELKCIVERKVKIDDIQDVTITSLSSDYGNEIATNLKIEDKAAINGMLINENNFEYYFKDYTGANLLIRTTNGKEYPMSRGNIPNIKQLLEKYGDERISINIDNSALLLKGTKLTNEDNSSLRKAIKDDLDGITYNELYDILKGDREIFMLSAIEYKNHKLTSAGFNASKMENIYKTVTKIMNKSAYTHATEFDFANMTYMPDFQKYVVEKNPNLKFGTYDDYEYEMAKSLINDTNETDEIMLPDLIFDVLRNIDKITLREYLYNHKDDEFDRTKPFFALWFVTSDGGFYSNDIEGLYKIFAKVFNDKISNNYEIKLNEI